MSRSDKHILYTISLKHSKTCSSEIVFSKQVQKVLSRKPDHIILSGRWFEAIFILNPSAIKSLKREGFKITMVRDVK